MGIQDQKEQEASPPTPQDSSPISKIKKLNRLQVDGVPSNLVKGHLSENTSRTNSHKIAEKLGMSQESYLFIRKLLILKERTTIPSDERAQLEKALSLIDETRQLIEARALTYPIIKKHWARKTDTGISVSQTRSNNKQKQKLDNMVFRIWQTASFLEELEIPNLETEVRKDTTKKVNEAITALSILLGKLLGETDAEQTEPK